LIAARLAAIETRLVHHANVHWQRDPSADVFVSRSRRARASGRGTLFAARGYRDRHGAWRDGVGHDSQKSTRQSRAWWECADRMEILFCGDTFASARVLLQDRLGPASTDRLSVWADANAPMPVERADVIVPMMFPVTAALMDASHCRLIHQWGSGLEGVDLAAAQSRGIWVASVPTTGRNADSVAEHVLLLILSLLRRLPEALANTKTGVLGAPLGLMLAGRTVCLYGLGATALSLAKRLRAFDVHLVGITRNPEASTVAGFGLDRCYSSRQRDECLSSTDILVLCTRLCAETRGMIDARALAALPSTALLVNAARGALIDYTALYEALSSGQLAGAGLDVYWQEPIASSDRLLALPNVMATPHVAGVTDRSYGHIADVVAANIERLRWREPPINRAV
jgi:phosphoglycerate dehydrogenase-like enzyme